MSMKDIGILDGDLLAVHRTSDVHNGQVVVARVEEDVTVKRLERRGREVLLHAENEEFLDQADAIAPFLDNHTDIVRARRAIADINGRGKCGRGLALQRRQIVCVGKDNNGRMRCGFYEDGCRR